MPERKWKTFLEKHRDEVTHLAYRYEEDGTGFVYINIGEEVRYNKKSRRMERYYHKFEVGGRG